MKRIIDYILSLLSVFAAVPTGWAIYAGITKQPAFPMWKPAAFIGALAVIVVDIVAASLVVDIDRFNQTLKNQTERTLSMSTKRAWFILGGAIVAEIILALVIVVIEGLLVYGVVVFPALTLAGVFAYAVRMDLEKREVDRDALRKHSKRTPSATPKESETVQTQSKASPNGWPKKCKYCNDLLEKPQSVGGHMKKHHPDKCIQKAYPAGVLQEASK